MEGVSVTDANEIYLETVPENFVRCLRSAQNAKSVKIKLTKKHTPCLTFEVELVSSRSSNNSKRYVLITAQCTLVHMRGLGIACHLSVCQSVRLSVCL